MWQLVIKYAVTAGLVVLVNEVVIRYSKEWLGSLIASLPVGAPLLVSKDAP